MSRRGNVIDKAMKRPLVSIVVLNHNGMDVLEPCLRSVLGSDYPNFEVILVDNSSTDGSFEKAVSLFKKDSRFRTVQNSENLGYVGNNSGAMKAEGKYVIFLNNDIEVDPSFLQEIVKVMDEHDDVGAAQPKIRLFSEPNKIGNVGLNIDFVGLTIERGRDEIDVGQYDFKSEIFAASGAALVVKKKVLDEVGLFDSTYFINHEDVDLCWRIRLRGYKILLIPKAVIYHHSGAWFSRNINPVILWHTRKNRMSTLIKNYSIKNLLNAIPIVLFIYFVIFIYESMIDRKLRYAMTSVSALLYNLRRLRSLVQQRILVQNSIRRISDDEVTRLMEQTPYILWALIKFRLRRMIC